MGWLKKLKKIVDIVKTIIDVLLPNDPGGSNRDKPTKKDKE
jgi:hypothetical protein